MKQITTILLAGSAAIFMTACGGGSSDGTVITPPPETSTPAPEIKYDLRTYLDTASFTVNAEGTVDGTATQATFYTEYVGDADVQGTTVNVHETVLTINGNVVNSYTGTYLGNVYAIEGTARDCYIVSGATPTPIPTDATIGYISDIVPLECSDGATASVSLKVQDGGGDNALLVGKSILNINGQVLVSESFSTVDPEMNLLAYELKIGDNIYFKSTSITQY